LPSLQFFANSIQFPINGTLVLSLIPQQTSFSAQDLQTQSIFFVASGHSHTFVDSNQVHGVDQLLHFCSGVFLLLKSSANISCSSSDIIISEKTFVEKNQIQKKQTRNNGLMNTLFFISF
jgi:hypothetical protein